MGHGFIDVAGEEHMAILVVVVVVLFAVLDFFGEVRHLFLFSN